MATTSTYFEELYARLALEEEEEEGVVVSEGEVRKNQKTYVLVERFSTEKNINFTAMKNVLASLWRPKEGVEIHDLGGASIFIRILSYLGYAECIRWRALDLRTKLIGVSQTGGG